ncbi:MAG TPA: cysteine desulfurase family protein [Rhizomicrobium sp.]|jgi:cysteine desulfurase|nr:cysteine desulfurase family protein [Rhizomicrobium sp.]
MAYLDHNATSPLRPEARAAMEYAFALGGNPSSVHGAGRAARAIIERARDQVATLAGARAQDVTFTSGGTEANALALWGAVQGAAEAGQRITRLFVCAIEHNSVLANATAIAERIPGIRLEIIPVTTDGTVDLEALRVMLREGKGRVLAAVAAANNETGVLQPLAEIRKLLKEHDAYLLVDAVQAAGKIALNASLSDYLSLSAHKLGGPQGSGALIVREGAPLAAMMLGGGHERGHRAGTENVSGIAGFGAAAAAATAPSSALRDRFESELKAIAPDAVIFGADVPRLATTSNFALPGIAAGTAMMALDLDGVMVSSGSACSSGKVKSSHVLRAMGVSDDLAGSALRVSFGWNSTDADVGAAIASISKLLARVAQKAA